MKYLLDKLIVTKKAGMKRSVLFTLLLALSMTALAQFPEKPEPFYPVNDFANVLNEQQKNNLAQELADFNRKTSTAIVFVTVNDLGGYDKAEYAVDLAHAWKLGQKGKDNGILILVKPKTANSRGEAFIAVGYGLEAVVPDAVAKQIVEYEMIPEFKTGNYYGGFVKATKVLMDLTVGEYTADQYSKNKSGGLAGLIPFFFFIIFFVFFSMKGRGRASGMGSRSNLPFWALLFMGNSFGGGGRSSGGWSDFNSGGGSFGGGFGGFSGGGGFGGGGAGGSW